MASVRLCGSGPHGQTQRLSVQLESLAGSLSALPEGSQGSEPGGNLGSHTHQPSSLASSSKLERTGKGNSKNGESSKVSQLALISPRP